MCIHGQMHLAHLLTMRLGIQGGVYFVNFLNRKIFFFLQGGIDIWVVLYHN